MDTTRVGKYVIKYNNLKEFHSLKSEIFGSKCYDMDLDNNAPYIIDIGAYIGLSTIYFKSIYPNSKILAVEPNPYSREILEENVFLNNLLDIDIASYAIDSNSSRKTLYIDNSEKKWHSTSGFFKNSWNGEYTNSECMEVETRTLNSLLDKPVDLLKLDIEGIEERVLKASKDNLKNVKNIIVEYHPRKDNNIKNIITLLESSSFKLSYYIDGKEIEKPIKDTLLIIKGRRL